MYVNMIKNYWYGRYSKMEKIFLKLAFVKLQGIFYDHFIKNLLHSKYIFIYLLNSQWWRYEKIFLKKFCQKKDKEKKIIIMLLNVNF